MVRPTALPAVVDSLEAVEQTASSSSAKSTVCYGETGQHNISQERFFAAASNTMAKTVTTDFSSDIHSHCWIFYNVLVMYEHTLKHDKYDTKGPWPVFQSLRLSRTEASAAPGQCNISASPSTRKQKTAPCQTQTALHRKL